jgi:FlaG/FlaF family flagellin (archaellin)
MDFLDPKKRRSYNIRLFLGLVLIAIAIVLATTILALITAGYTINRKTGQVVQNSLVFVNSQPSGASIYINGKLNGSTNARFDLSAGNYTFSIYESGYHNWSNTIALYGGQVEQLNYPVLFPLNPVKTTNATLTSQPTISTYTPDRHWLLVSVPGQLGSFDMVDLHQSLTLSLALIPSR